MSATENTRSKEELSKCIMDTAAQLFSEHGVESVSMHQIAKSAGVGQGTLYRRYANKADLCIGLMQDTFDQMQCTINGYIRETTERPVQERLRGVIGILLDFLGEKSKMLGVIHAQFMTESNKDDFYQSPPYLFMHDMLTGLISELPDEDSAMEIDAPFIAHSYIAILSPHTYRHLVCVKGYSHERIYEQFCSLYIDPLFKS
ncbi:TetR/AcrR family transcriptional regulator [Paenibacillus sp. 1011MAR3C5]|uniref:TetR/AcrR family transcriptional regulator n=1 Tax=Paenibacillus sp. 1011MAR3C5 TaxID=1675787 RepID=UPI000E6C14B5|nr:TetR/AcrR family transcriptional regulator [Paenibacillus sp. 1011MAR3C5]RJE86835.1 TetR/AcrR family transcriptional regulator [Paenibacillus sp. 1011MAR3C5]